MLVVEMGMDGCRRRNMRVPWRGGCAYWPQSDTTMYGSRPLTYGGKKLSEMLVGPCWCQAWVSFAWCRSLVVMGRSLEGMKWLGRLLMSSKWRC